MPVTRTFCSITLKIAVGTVIRKNCYYLLLWSLGDVYRNKVAAQSFPEYLGEYRLKRSQKPQAVYDRLIAHSLPPGGRWIDPFPATHDEIVGELDQRLILAPTLWKQE